MASGLGLIMQCCKRLFLILSLKRLHKTDTKSQSLHEANCFYWTLNWPFSHSINTTNGVLWFNIPRVDASEASEGIRRVKMTMRENQTHCSAQVNYRAQRFAKSYVAIFKGDPSVCVS